MAISKTSKALATAAAGATILGAIVALFNLFLSSHSNEIGTTKCGNNNLVVNNAENYTINCASGEVELKSDNPRKELMAMGVSWDEDNFRRAMLRKDVTVVALFLKGDMKFRSNGSDNVFETAAMVEDKVFFDPNIISLFSRKTFDSDDFCPLPRFEINNHAGLKGIDTSVSIYGNSNSLGSAYNFPFSPELYEEVFNGGNESKVAFIKRICGLESVIRKIDSLHGIVPYMNSLSSNDKKFVDRWRQTRIWLSGTQPNW